ncbi:hypothetical protein HHI36_017719 [Cryptolaemus montrouzieri]
MIFFILLFVPVGNMVEKTSLRTTAIISSGLTTLGNGLKLFATSPDMFYVALIAQIICAIAEIFMLITPSKVASVWFGAEEVSTACAIGVLGSQMGTALGLVVPTLIVNESDDNSKIEKGLSEMFTYNAVASTTIFVSVLLFFRSKPPSPPSQSQVCLLMKPEDENIMTYWSATKEFMRNKDFLLVLFSMGIGVGFWTASGMIINQIYVHFFPTESIAVLGILTAVSCVAGGSLGTMFFGYILDVTHKFRLVTFSVLLLNTITFTIQAYYFLTSNFIGVIISVPINGFFNGSLMVISFEYAIETTYPIPEAFGASMLNVVIYIFAIIYVVGLNIVFETAGFLVGHIIMGISLLAATLSVLLISPELRRRNANLMSPSNIK